MGGADSNQHYLCNVQCQYQYYSVLVETKLLYFDEWISPMFNYIIVQCSIQFRYVIHTLSTHTLSNDGLLLWQLQLKENLQFQVLFVWWNVSLCLGNCNWQYVHKSQPVRQWVVTRLVRKLAARCKRLRDRCIYSLFKNIYNDSHYSSILLNAYFVDLKSKNISSFF